MGIDSSQQPGREPEASGSSGGARRASRSSNASAPAPAPARALRSRTSLPAAPAAPTRPGSARVISNEEREHALYKLGTEGTLAKRDELVRDHEAQVRAIVEEHDMAVKEKFHLERYTSILEGWDPVDAKNENTPVFMEYKNLHHDLLSLVPSTVHPPAASSSRSRALGPSRTTRRQLHSKAEAFGNVTAIGEPKTAAGKGKGKEVEEPPAGSGSRRKSQAASDAEMAPPPPPAKGKKGARRVTASEAELREVEDDEIEAVDHGKKRRGRQSLPAIPSKKSRLLKEDTESASSPGPATSEAGPSTPVRTPSPSPAPPLPSLAHLPFPPPPKRTYPRRTGSSHVTFTDPGQRLLAKPKFEGDVNALLESYIHIEDSGHQPDLTELETRAAREGYFRNRVNWLQHQGRLLRLLDEDDEAPTEKVRDKSHQKRPPTGPPPRQTDYQDALLNHMVQVRNAIVSEAKLKPIVCKKIARMIQQHWEFIEGKEDRERAAEEKERKRKAKEVVKSLRKRWGLATKIVRAKVVAAQKLEQDRLGKEHLQNMLQRSTGLLEGQRDVIVGREGTHDEADEDEDVGSDGTEDVSAAEDSEEEGAEEEAGEVEGGEAQDGEEGGEEGGEEAGGQEGETVEVEPNTDAEAEDGVEVEAEASGEESGEEDGDDEEDEEEEDEDDEERPDLRILLGDDVDMGEDDAEPADDVLVQANSAVETSDAKPDSDLPTAQATSSSAPETTAAEPAPAPEAEVVVAAVTSPIPVSVQQPLAPAELPADPAPAPATEPTVPVVPASQAFDLHDPDAVGFLDSMEIDNDEIDAAFDAVTPMTSVTAAVTPALTPAATTPAVTPPRSVIAPLTTARDNNEMEIDGAEIDAAFDSPSGTLPADSVPAPPAAPVAPEANGTSGPPAPLTNGTSPAAEETEDLPPPRAPSRRLAKKARSLAALADTPDPDANDTEFKGPGSDLDDQDAQLDVEMEDAEAIDGADSEDEGLLADANMPIEELLKRYGVPDPSKPADPETAPEPKNDQSLTDSALESRANDTPLIVEGKRQRRVRTVWTPERDAPQMLSKSPKRGKVEEVEEEDEEVVMSPTPELSSEEEDEEESAEEDEVASLAGETDAPRIRPPFLLRGTLRPYQQGGLEWLASLYANNMNGILADEMGLGKTIQTIALLGHLACDLGVWGQHLIIVPTSVILNWEMEFKKFFPGMKVLTYYGNQKERKEKRVGWHTENAWQVCITSYQIVLADQHIFRRKNWVYMILDEAHNIKNFRSQRWQTLLGFKTQRRLLLTGTPLQNNLMELWSLLYFLMPNGITADATAVVGFANHKEFTEWFSNPMDKAVESGETLDEETIQTVNKLHTLLRPFILRRLKSEVETQLPGKFEHVVYCRLSKRQRFLYDEFMSRASTREALTSGGYLGVVNILMQLRKVCNHPDLFEVRPVRTSFAMERSVVSDFEPTDLLVRKRLLAAQDDSLDFDAMNLTITKHENESGWVAGMRARLDASNKLPHAIEPVAFKRVKPPKPDTRTPEGWAKWTAHVQEQASIARWQGLRDVNRLRCQSGPIYGSTTLAMLSGLPRYLLPESMDLRRRIDMIGEHTPPAAPLITSLVDRVHQMTPVIDRFAVIPPNAVARDMPQYALPAVDPAAYPTLQDPDFDSLHGPTVRLQIAFPDVSLLQYDCGKLQKLAEMLRDLKAGGHRVLIFTQMTKVLDILEIFLSYSGHRYLRLDGSTKIEDRQVITERFNSDPRIFCFIASSRSGGVGINLTGADTVFFYDSDWNPSMDRQCMDRAHRIGQTREVHIYRFVSSHTVEENMLKKANQKRLLDRVVIQDGDFTTEFFGRMDWRDMLDEDMKAAAEESRDDDRIEDIDVEQGPEAEDAEAAAPRLGQERDFAAALAEVEDEEDVAAAKMAQGEGEMDFAEFGGEDATKKGGAATAPAAPAAVSRLGTEGKTEGSGTGVSTPLPEDDDEYYDDDEPGAIDEYMLRYVEWEWDYFSSL